MLMSRAEAITFDTKTLRHKSMAEICDIVDKLIDIILDDAQQMDRMEGIIESLQSDARLTEDDLK